MGGVYNGQAEDVVAYHIIPVLFDIETALSLNAIASHNGLTPESTYKA